MAFQRQFTAIGVNVSSPTVQSTSTNPLQYQSLVSWLTKAATPESNTTMLVAVVVVLLVVAGVAFWWFRRQQIVFFKSNFEMDTSPVIHIKIK